jgi:hypothetical protein
VSRPITINCQAVYESRRISFVREFYADLDCDDTGNLIIKLAESSSFLR